MPLLRIELLGQIHGLADVGEQNRNLLALALDCSAQVENLGSQMGRRVRPRSGRGTLRRSARLGVCRRGTGLPRTSAAARRTKACPGRKGVPAAHALAHETRSAFHAELRAGGVLGLANRAAHALILARIVPVPETPRPCRPEHSRSGRCRPLDVAAGGRDNARAPTVRAPSRPKEWPRPCRRRPGPQDPVPADKSRIQGMNKKRNRATTTSITGGYPRFLKFQ